MKHKTVKIPGIGMRIIKSAIAVAICFLVDLLRGGDGIVFYSMLAAIWCIQIYRSNTIENAAQRVIGTVFGAVYGLIYLIIYRVIDKHVSNMHIYEILVVPLMTILVLYTTVLLKKKQAAYFSCVVLLSITVNHAGDVNPYFFVWNRLLDTIIGIFIGILVNEVSIHRHTNKDTLFISELDDTLLSNSEILSAYSKVELNRMIEKGLKFTVSTMRTPASLMEPMKDIKLNLPVIAMDGAVLYDIKKKQFMRVYVISPDTALRLMKRIEAAKLSWYANVIIDDTLLIYYSSELDEVNKDLVERMRVSPYRNYLRRPLPNDEDVVYIMLLDKTEVITKFYDELVKVGFGDDLKISVYPSPVYEGYSHLRIYNKNATRENMITYLKQQIGIEDVVTVGAVPDKYDILVSNNNENTVVKVVRKNFEVF